MRLQDPNTGQVLADKYLLPQISVLFWAGFDTTGNTMAWTLFCISQHPEVGSQLSTLPTVLDCPPFGITLKPLPSPLPISTSSFWTPPPPTPTCPPPSQTVRKSRYLACPGHVGIEGLLNMPAHGQMVQHFFYAQASTCTACTHILCSTLTPSTQPSLSHLPSSPPSPCHAPCM